MRVDEAIETSGSDQNVFGMKVLAVTLMVVGFLVLVLGFLTEEARALVLSVGGTIIFISLLIHPSVKIGKGKVSTNNAR